MKKGNISRREFLSGMLAVGALTALPAGYCLAAEETEQRPGAVEHFPAIVCGESGRIWMASTARTQSGDFIQVDRIENSLRKNVCRLRPERLTGIAPPAVAAWEDGCIVAFPVERDDRWHIAYCFLTDESTGVVDISFLPCKGTSNISPTLAATGDRISLLWESNAGGNRAIYSTWVRPNGVGKVRRISHRTANSYNPTLVALGDGRLFGAWDSLRQGCADIYGAWFENGKWRKEKRLTSDARVERHPYLATHNEEVWMTWQAQSSTTKLRRLNLVNEQRVVVARIADGELHAPRQFFEAVSTEDRRLMRPRIGFDHSGGLWLTANLGMNMLQAGWKPVLWRYAGEDWSEMLQISDYQGLWHPSPMAFPPHDEAVVVTQHDDLPRTYDDTLGTDCEYKSAINLHEFPEPDEGTIELRTEILEMPPTEFSLGAIIEVSGAELPKQKWKCGDQTLNLYWGDLHEHTDLSVCDRRQNPPGHDLFANLRDIERLDFAALTDHGYNFDPAQWRLNGEQTRNNHDPSRFVTFLGQEWTSAVMRKSGGYGHRNLIYLDPYYDKFYDAFDGDVTPADVWKAIGNTEFICIPHQLADWQGKGKGNPPTDWNFVDEKLQPVAEVWQVRGSYEYLGCPRQAGCGKPEKGPYIQDVWARGDIIGVIASPDHGGGAGKVGVWASELSRESIFKAIQARHTFGTSGAKIALRFRSGDAMMGDVIQRNDSPLVFRIAGHALYDISEVVVFRNNEVVLRSEPGAKEFDLKWIDENPPEVARLWYYARIQTSDDELAWSSPIWFMR